MQNYIDSIMNFYHKPVSEDYVEKFEKEMLEKSKYSKELVEERNPKNSEFKEKLLAYRKRKVNKEKYSSLLYFQ